MTRHRLATIITAGLLLVGAVACGSEERVTYDSKNDWKPPPTSPSDTTTTVPDPPGRHYIATAPTADQPVALFQTAGGEESPITVPNPNEHGVIATFLVLQRGVQADGEEWLEVALPVRPNGSTAWVRASDVTISFTDLVVTIALTEHRLRVTQGGDQVIKDFPIGVGTTETPTPGGVFYIKELLRPTNSDGAYGPYAFGLSGFSNVITESDQFGDGVIGIHGTNQPETVGTDVSHGCIRLLNEDLSQLVGLLPLGTPVEVIA